MQGKVQGVSYELLVLLGEDEQRKNLQFILSCKVTFLSHLEKIGCIYFLLLGRELWQVKCLEEGFGSTFFQVHVLH